MVEFLNLQLHSKDFNFLKDLKTWSLHCSFCAISQEGLFHYTVIRVKACEALCTNTHSTQTRIFKDLRLGHRELTPLYSSWSNGRCYLYWWPVRMKAVVSPAPLYLQNNSDITGATILCGRWKIPHLPPLTVLLTVEKRLALLLF